MSSTHTSVLSLVMLRRFFAGIGSLREVGPLPANFAKYFQLLAAPDIYKQQDKLVKVLHCLTVDYKKRFNPQNITELTTWPAVKSMLTQLPAAIKESNADNAIKLMRSLSFMRIRDQRVWTALEKRLSLVLHQTTDESNVVYAIECFQRAGQDSPRLWNALESALLTTICPKHSLSAREVTAVLHAFGVMNKGSQQLLDAMEQQVLRVATGLQGSDLVKILNVFAKNKLGGEDLYKSLNRQCKTVCGQMTAYEVALALCLFLRMNKTTPDLLERLEEVMKQAFSQLSFRSVASVIEAYAGHLANNTLTPGPRRDFILFLCQETFKVYNPLLSKEKEDGTKALVSFGWGLSVLRIHHNLALLKRVLTDLRSRDLQDFDRGQLAVIQRFCENVNLP